MAGVLPRVSSFALLVALLTIGCSPRSSIPVQPSVAGEENLPEDDAFIQQVHDFCGYCHQYPKAEIFPRSVWKMEVERGYQFYERSGLALDPPALKRVVRYYEKRAPEQLTLPELSTSTTPLPIAFERQEYSVPKEIDRPAISNISVVSLSAGKLPDLLACDMKNGHILFCNPRDEKPTWRILATVSNPASVKVIDLDRDGINDLLVADLGSYLPTERKSGKVIWLRGDAKGNYTPFTLLEKVGRVADVSAADFRGSGKLDLVVAVYGWNESGETMFLENQTSDWNNPKFAAKSLDGRHGPIHVPVVDLNGDGKPDFMALIAQEHEAIIAFLNDGKGDFTKQTLFKGEHPGLGSSGIELVDLDKDGDLDILYTNGDVLDQPYLLKPYHRVQWLENKGNLKFESHLIGTMYGVHRALAADFTGDGKLDIVAVSFLPKEGFPDRESKKLDSVVLFEQTEKGKFIRHTLEYSSCEHVTCAVGDIFGTGKQDIVTANFSGNGPAVTVFRNGDKK
jgi:hypothetical protein